MGENNTPTALKGCGVKKGVLDTEEAAGDLALVTGAFTGEKTAFAFGFIVSNASILVKRVDHSFCKESKRLSRSLEGLEIVAEPIEVHSPGQKRDDSSKVTQL